LARQTIARFCSSGCPIYLSWIYICLYKISMYDIYVFDIVFWKLVGIMM